MKKVRILNEDGTAFKTRIIDMETGEELERIGRVEMNFDASSGPITARLTQYWVGVDIIADAEIKQVCPCCGKSVQEQKP